MRSWRTPVDEGHGLLMLWPKRLRLPLACQSIAMTWYATAGHDPADVADRRARLPWYKTKATPSTADITAKLRRVLIAASIRAPHPDQPTPEEIRAIRLAWDTAVA